MGAGRLRAGDRLLGEEGGWLAVECVEETGELAAVYNLRVADYHTFFVGGDGWGFSVWAHNTCTVKDVNKALEEAGLGKSGGKAPGNLAELANKNEGKKLLAELERLRPQATAQERETVAKALLAKAGHPPLGSTPAAGAAPQPSVPTSPRPGRMHVEPVEFSKGSGRDFVVPGRSRPELFSARLMNGSNTLEVNWTESLGQGTLVNRLAQAQQLAGGPGSFTRITGMASDNLQGLIQSGRFKAQEAAQALGQRLGGRWHVDVTPRPNSTTWDITTTRLGD